jgi:hypothetical protein
VRGLCKWKRASRADLGAGTAGVDADTRGELDIVPDQKLRLPEGNAADFPILVFVHGTASISASHAACARP